MVKENRAHRDHKLNPRKHTTGLSYPDNSTSKISEKLIHVALLSKDEMHFIQDVPRILGSGDYANLGHSRGGSAILMADSLRENNLNGKVYSIDLFPLNKHIRDAKFQLNKFKVEKYIELCAGDTNKWAEKLKDKKFNFVFIDADHTYEAVKEDFKNWSNLVKSGGWISFHDTNQDFSHQAISDTIEKDKNWREIKYFHIDRIRTFEKILHLK